MLEKDQYTQEAAEELGYDWVVVQYFLSVDQELLARMWGSGSAHYDGILKNSKTLKEIKTTLEMVGKIKTIGDVYDSSVLMRNFLVTISLR